jgi:hypothetical protein
VTTSDSFLRLRDYIQANPGKRFLVATPEQYPYSSAFPKFELDAPPQRLKPFLDQSFGGIAEAMPLIRAPPGASRFWIPTGSPKKVGSVSLK